MSNFRGGEGAYKKAFDQSKSRLHSFRPAEIQRKSLCKYDPVTGLFSLESLGHTLEISYANPEVTFGGVKEKVPMEWALIVLNYLSSSRDISIEKELVTYRDLPLGNVFFPNIKKNVLKVLADFYSDSDKEKLSSTLSGLGFQQVDSSADLTVNGYFAPRVPIMLRFWEGDDEIPSSCQILFDTTIAEQMHIEDIAALCGIVKNLIIGRC